MRELREIFQLTADEDEKAQINLLEKAFRGPITTAINRELNRLYLAVGEWISPRLILEKLAELGAQDGMLLDGGGSSCLAIGEGAIGIRPGVMVGGWRPVATCFGVRARLLPDSR